MLTRKSSFNPAFVYGNEVNQICQGIFRRYNLNAFSYSRIYPDGARTELWSNVNSLKHFLLKQYVRETYTPDLFEGKKFVLYDIIVHAFPPKIKIQVQTQLNDQRELFDFANCLFLIEYQAQYTEYFAFYTPQSHTQAINAYLNNRDQLSRFCKYFRRRARQLIQDADKEKLILPWRDKDTGMILPEKNLYRPKIALSLPINDIRQTNPLSPRETEVVDLLCEGISTKEIAVILFISKRTVEKHIENIKIKMGYQNRYQLIQHTIRSSL